MPTTLTAPVPTTTTEPRWPPCGMADCNARAVWVCGVGCGWCMVHEAEPLALPVRLAQGPDDFDPWWAAATMDPEAFAGLDYGEWPTPPAAAPAGGAT